jgi:aromatic ring-opening dioxygenase catalytic subunit (LigB family)
VGEHQLQQRGWRRLIVQQRHQLFGLDGRMGQALAPLAERGCLIVASGNITHNLRDCQLASRGMAVDNGYAERFSGWVAEQLSTGQPEPLLGYRQHNPDAQISPSAGWAAAAAVHYSRCSRGHPQGPGDLSRHPRKRDNHG